MIKSSLIVCIALIMSTGCALFKGPSEQEKKGLSAVAPSTVDIIETIQREAVDFSELTFNAILGITVGGSENSVNATFRIRKDSVIWISARKLGFEIGRLMLTEDSVWLMDRINNQYFEGDYLFFQRQFNIDADYNLVESLLLGNPLSNWSSENVVTDCSDERICTIKYPGRYRINQGRDHRARPEGSTETIQELKIARSNGKILRNEIAIPAESRSIAAEYGQFRMVSNKNIPASTIITIDNQGDITRLNINADAVTINQPATYPFRIPTNYKPIITNQVREQ